MIETERALLKFVEGPEAHRVINTNSNTNTENIRKSKYKPNKSLKSKNITPNPKITRIGKVVGEATLARGRLEEEWKRMTGSRSADDDGGRA